MFVYAQSTRTDISGPTQRSEHFNSRSNHELNSHERRGFVLAVNIDYTFLKTILSNSDCSPHSAQATGNAQTRFHSIQTKIYTYNLDTTHGRVADAF